MLTSYTIYYLIFFERACGPEGVLWFLRQTILVLRLAMDVWIEVHCFVFLDEINLRKLTIGILLTKLFI